MSFTKLFQRTSLPFDNGSDSVLSPLTPRTKTVPLFGDTPLIQDILNNNVTKNVDIHGRGNWGVGKDDFTSFKEKGDEFMIDEKITEILKRMKEIKKDKNEKWVAITTDNKEIEFPSQDVAQRKLREEKIPYKFLFRKLAQNYYYDHINNALAASFEIESYSKVSRTREIGAAFAIKKGIFMTCAHCIMRYNKLNMPAEEKPYTEIFLIKNGQKTKANLVDIDFAVDVAIVESDIDSPVLQFESSKKTLIGTRVFTVGSPSGFEGNVTEGILSSKNRVIFNYPRAIKYLFTDAQVLPGSSGGALISSDNGKVIGMMALIISSVGFYGLNAAIPSEELIKFLKK